MRVRAAPLARAVGAKQRLEPCASRSRRIPASTMPGKRHTGGTTNADYSRLSAVHRLNLRRVHRRAPCALPGAAGYPYSRVSGAMRSQGAVAHRSAIPAMGRKQAGEPRPEQPGPREAREIHHPTLPDHGMTAQGKGCD